MDGSETSDSYSAGQRTFECLKLWEPRYDGMFGGALVNGDLRVVVLEGVQARETVFGTRA